DPALLDYLAGLPNSLSLERDGLRIAVFHGAPWDDPGDTSAHYVYANNTRDLRRVAEVEADVVILGHTHRPFALKVDSTLIVNPGSCDDPRDGTNLLSCAVLETEARTVEFRPFS